MIAVAKRSRENTVDLERLLGSIWPTDSMIRNRKIPSLKKALLINLLTQKGYKIICKNNHSVSGGPSFFLKTLPHSTFIYSENSIDSLLKIDKQLQFS